MSGFPATALAALCGAVPVAFTLTFATMAQAVAALGIGAIVGAGIAAAVAVLARADRDEPGVSAWDVAGLFALIGFGAGMVASPESIVRYFGLS